MALTQVDQGLLGTYAQYTGFKNRIINGAMNIWQRGTTYALTNGVAYGSADRWAFAQAVTANGVANQQASSLTGFQFELQLGRNAAATTTNAIFAIQAIETANSIDMAGGTVTLSFYAKAGANYSAASNAFGVQIYSGTGTDQSAASIGSWTGGTLIVNSSVTLTTSYQRFTVTGTVASTAKQLGIQLFYTPTGTAGADDKVYITGVQLEKGSTATSFDYRPYGTELALCQRYYWRWTGTEQYLTATFIDGTRKYSFFVAFPVTMRTNPTLTSSTMSYRNGSTYSDGSVTASGNYTNGSYVQYYAPNATDVWGTSAPCYITTGWSWSAEL